MPNNHWKSPAQEFDPSRRRVLGLCGLGIGSALLPGMTMANEVPEPSESPVRIVSYNIKHGQGMDGKLDLGRTAAVLEELDADVIALQEVDRNCTRSGKVDQPEWLGKRLGMHPRFAKFMDFQGGEYGLAILSKTEPAADFRHVLPEGAEPRSALEVVLPAGNQGESEISVVCLHFDWTTPARRIPQINALLKALEDRDRPVVLVGDFNADPGSETMKLAGEYGLPIPKEDAPETFSAGKPGDRNRPLRAQGIQISRSRGSPLPHP